MRLQAAERGFEMRFLGLALGMTKVRQQHLAVEHDRGIGGEYEIRQAIDRRHEINVGAKVEQAAMKARPLPVRRGGERGFLARPAARIHPRIDAVDDAEMLRPAHQEVRFGLRICCWCRHPVVPR